MITSLDEPRALRDEDAFDVDALHAWLGARVDGLGAHGPGRGDHRVDAQVTLRGGSAADLHRLADLAHVPGGAVLLEEGGEPRPLGLLDHLDTGSLH